MKYVGTSRNHCLSDYKMAVLKWLPGPAKAPSSYIPLVSHHFQSTFRGWEMIYARSLNRSTIKPLCAWVICQHPNRWDTPGNPGFFVMLPIHRAGYSSSCSSSYTAGVCLDRVIRTILSRASLKHCTWETALHKQPNDAYHRVFFFSGICGTEVLRKAILISHLCLKSSKQETNNLWGRRKTADSTVLHG